MSFGHNVMKVWGAVKTLCHFRMSSWGAVKHFQKIVSKNVMKVWGAVKHFQNILSFEKNVMKVWGAVKHFQNILSFEHNVMKVWGAVKHFQEILWFGQNVMKVWGAVKHFQEIVSFGQNVMKVWGAVKRFQEILSFGQNVMKVWGAVNIFRIWRLKFTLSEFFSSTPAYNVITNISKTNDVWTHSCLSSPKFYLLFLSLLFLFKLLYSREILFFLCPYYYSSLFRVTSTVKYTRTVV